jgi:hypothetical protein
VLRALDQGAELVLGAVVELGQGGHPQLFERGARGRFEALRPAREGPPSARVEQPEALDRDRVNRGEPLAHALEHPLAIGAERVAQDSSERRAFDLAHGDHVALARERAVHRQAAVDVDRRPLK